MNLIQKVGSEKRVFTILDYGLKCREENRFGVIERIVPFEAISNDFAKLKFNPVQWMIIAVVILLIVVSGFFLRLYGIEGVGHLYYYLFVALLGGLFGLLFYGEKETVLGCYDDIGISFYKDAPNKPDFDEFIRVLFQRRDEVLKKKYAFVSPLFPYKEQLEKITLLHTLGVIKFQEFKFLKNQLALLVRN